MKDLYGGNVVNRFGTNDSVQSCFAQSPYRYFMIRLRSDSSSFRIENLQSFTLLLLSKTEQTSVSLSWLSTHHSLEVGAVIQGEGTTAEIAIQGGRASEAVVLIAGICPGPREQDQSELRQKGCFISSLDSVKRVTKPWGYELWIHGEHPGYAFKQIWIQMGTKTSLQYHQKKQETNVLFQGQVRLYFKSNQGVKNDQVQSTDLGSINLSPISSIDVSPNTLHRLEALTDVLLYEVSTPHLDDVIRVSDDSARGNGRIAGEHKKS